MDMEWQWSGKPQPPVALIHPHPKAPRTNWLGTTLQLAPCSQVTVPSPERAVTSPRSHRKSAAKPGKQREGWDAEGLGCLGHQPSSPLTFTRQGPS